MSEIQARPPVELPEVLLEELDSFGGAPGALDPNKPADERLREVYKRIGDLQPERSALCISGGGIRSATFALGVVQALAKAGLLPKFDYLSTVSGGGYIGSMLSAWIHTHPRKIEGVAEDLAGASDGGHDGQEAAPVRHLRRFSNYIAPRLGIFSADGWTLVATALRNLLLNWTVLVLMLAGLLVLPWLGLLGILGKPTIGQLDALLAAAFVCIAAATAYPGLDLPSQGCFAWKQKWFVVGWLAPLVGGIVCMASWWAGRTNYYPSSTSNETEVAYYQAHALPDAADWMENGNGKWCVAGFLVAASAAGILACVIITLLRDLRRGTLDLRFNPARTKKIIGMVVASVLVIGTPGAAVLWFMAVKIFPSPGSDAAAYLTFAPAATLTAFFLMNSLFVGVTSRVSDDDDREWFARAAGWLGAVVVGWLVVHGLVFWVPRWVEINLGPAMRASVAASGGIVGFIAAKIGASEKTPAFLQQNPAMKKNLLLTGAALLFFGLLSCGVSQLLDRGLFVHSMLAHVPAGWRVEQPLWWRTLEPRASLAQVNLELEVPATEPSPLVEDSAYALARIDRQVLALPDITDVFTNPPDPWLTMLNDRTSYRRFGLLLIVPEVYAVFGKKLALVLSGLFGGGLVMGYFVNVNRFSLHATYRNRLVRAYLGAARAFAGPDGRPLRQPHPFTGFDPADNIKLASLTQLRPFHVLNMTLNLVAGAELAWQERKADSFTASRLHSGNRRLGYRATEEYADGLTLGTALAISGAAANPNQGYNSSPLLSFLMTLFNVRLGWWLGNPGASGRRAWTRSGPSQAAFPLFAEALGLTNENRAYVNLSDGGHFENLGIHEMLIRRCRFIVVSDAEQDGDYHFEGLGGIVRKARIDMGVEIEFPDLAAVSKETPEARRRGFVLGTVRYPEGVEGRMLYIKPLLLADVPADVRHYADTHATFPHESTSDQFFSESQFEAYRALGFHEATAMLASADSVPKSVAGLFDALAAPCKDSMPNGNPAPKGSSS